jgi:hypothetical protein
MPSVSFKLSDGSIHKSKVSPNKFSALLLVSDAFELCEINESLYNSPKETYEQKIDGRGFVWGVGFDDMRGIKWADLA